jgi:hypothetical protein
VNRANQRLTSASDFSRVASYLTEVAKDAIAAELAIVLII